MMMFCKWFGCWGDYYIEMWGSGDNCWMVCKMCWLRCLGSFQCFFDDVFMLVVMNVLMNLFCKFEFWLFQKFVLFKVEYLVGLQVCMYDIELEMGFDVVQDCIYVVL